MILLGLLLGAAAVFAASFWSDLVNWLKLVAEKVREVIAKAVVGVKIFLKKVGEAIREISKNYSQDVNGRWHETIVTREVAESEVPEEIRAKVRKASSEVDVTKELELELR